MKTPDDPTQPLPPRIQEILDTPNGLVKYFHNYVNNKYNTTQEEDTPNTTTQTTQQYNIKLNTTTYNALHALAVSKGYFHHHSYPDIGQAIHWLLYTHTYTQTQPTYTQPIDTQPIDSGAAIPPVQPDDDADTQIGKRIYVTFYIAKSTQQILRQLATQNNIRRGPTLNISKTLDYIVHGRLHIKEHQNDAS